MTSNGQEPKPPIIEGDIGGVDVFEVEKQRRVEAMTTMVAQLADIDNENGVVDEVIAAVAGGLLELVDVPLDLSVHRRSTIAAIDEGGASPELLAELRPVYKSLGRLEGDTDILGYLSQVGEERVKLPVDQV